MSFIIHLKDVELEFSDIIVLNNEQQEKIQKESVKKTFVEWKNSETGIKIQLSIEQRNKVIAEKNALINGRNAKEILKSKTIIFSHHATERIAVRVDKFPLGHQPTLDSILLVIHLIVESDGVDGQAEWKGFRNLTYTLLNTHLDEKFKIAVTFEYIYYEHMKVITVSNEHIDRLTTNLLEDPHIKEKLERIKKQLFNQ